MLYAVPCAPAGRICVLDFGLVSEVTEEQRVGLVEFIAYLTMEDWDSVARWVAEGHAGHWLAGWVDGWVAATGAVGHCGAGAAVLPLRLSPTACQARHVGHHTCAP